MFPSYPVQILIWRCRDSEVLQHIFPEAEPTKALDFRIFSLHGNGATWCSLVFRNVSDIRTPQIISNCSFHWFRLHQKRKLTCDLFAMAHGPWPGGTFWWIPGRRRPREWIQWIQCRYIAIPSANGLRSRRHGAQIPWLAVDGVWWCLGMFWCIIDV